MSSNKIIQANFQNHFDNTPGIIEYGKFLSGDNLNGDRIIYTPTDVYGLGTESEIGAKGHGGAEHIIYMLDGQILRNKDLWHYRERKSSEPVTCLKIENVYNPYSSTWLRWDTFHSGISVDECLFMVIPWVIKEPINSNKVQFLSKEEALSKCTDAMFNVTYEIDEFIYQGLIKLINGSDAKYYVFKHQNGSDDIERDILKLLFSGESDLSKYHPLLLESSFQWSSAPFGKILAELKVAYYEYAVNKRTSAQFLEQVLKSRNDFITLNAL